MSKYIDAEWLKDLYEPYVSKGLSVPAETILANIEDAPSIEIVRCDECKYGRRCKYSDNVTLYKCGIRSPYGRTPDNFCSRGERRDDE